MLEYFFLTYIYMYLYAHVDRCCFIDCGGAPFLPLLFIVVNMAFNISLLNLVKMSSAVVASLTSTSAGSFSGTLLFSNFSWSLVVVPLGGTHQIK